MIESVRADNPGPYTLDGTMSWVLGKRVIIDPGPADPVHVENLLLRAPDLEAIFVTHRHADHAGALPMMKAACGVEVYGPDSVEGVDRAVKEGESYQFGDVELMAIATPGHTGEHFCYITPAGDLFTGDTVLGYGTTTIFLPDGDMRSYMSSLQRLIDLQPSRICPGHGPISEKPIQLLEYYLAHRKERERQIVEAMGSGASTPKQLREAIYIDLDPALHHAAELQIEAHLKAIEE